MGIFHSRPKREDPPASSALSVTSPVIIINRTHAIPDAEGDTMGVFNGASSGEEPPPYSALPATSPAISTNHTQAIPDTKGDTMGVFNSAPSREDPPEDPPTSSAPCGTSIFPAKTHEGLFVRLTPPSGPNDVALDHVPHDIVLLIDVSASMGAAAPAQPSQPGGVAEDLGLSILDLTKHAANTIISTLNESDRLSIVTFSFEATRNKKAVASRTINDMEPDSSTALCAGIRVGLAQFSKNKGEATESRFARNIPTMMVLTDGRPYGIGSWPDEGWTSRLRGWLGKMGERPPTIHTFGFGYDLEPGLLQTIAEVSGGGYSYIPDSSMLGTVLIHATANLQSMFARDAVLTLTYPRGLELQEPGIHVLKSDPRPATAPAENMTLQLRLNAIHYGQPRHIFLQGNQAVLAAAMARCYSPLHVKADLQYVHDATTYKVSAEIDIKSRVPVLEPTDAAFHLSRVMVASFISNLFPLNHMTYHQPLAEESLREKADSGLKALLDRLPANKALYKTDPRCLALMKDLVGDEAGDGQVTMALTWDAFTKWGRHYLPSLKRAHEHQLRVSFTDPGTQGYGADSRLFLERLKVLNEAFDKLRPPNPSRRGRARNTSSAPPATQNMTTSYNTCSRGMCFAAETRVLLGSRTTLGAPTTTTVGETTAVAATTTADTIAIKDLRPGEMVATPRGPRAVRAVLRHRGIYHSVVELPPPSGAYDALLVTPWHPVSPDGRTWVFPEQQPFRRKLDNFKGDVYSVLLQRGGDAAGTATEAEAEAPDGDHHDAHAINVNGVWGVTLGHGLVKSTSDDIRGHLFSATTTP